MAKPSVDPGVREALWDLQRYLSDEVAPTTVADSIGVLFRCPQQVAAGEIIGWLSSRRSGSVSAPPVWECLLHAMKKLHRMAEFNLIEETLLDRYLTGLGEIVLRFCPDQDRQVLADNLEDLRRTAAAGQEDPPHPVDGEEQEGEDRKPALMIEGIGHVALLASKSHALSLAALNARNGAEFGEYTKRLREEGIGVDAREVFRALGSSLPGWNLATGAPPNRILDAMHRLISRAKDHAQAAERFVALLEAAIEQFNSGNFARAQAMFELANTIIREKRLESQVVESFQQSAYETVAIQRLHELSQQPLRSDLLRTVLEFFPAFSPKVLLSVLKGEECRDRRMLQLALLEIHGQAARTEVLERFETFSGDLTNDSQGYFQRNLIYLLRHIERSGNSQKELKLLVRSSELDQPPIVIREAVGALATWKHIYAERSLAERLDQIEAAMSGTDDTVMAHDQLEALLDRTVAALAKLGTANAMRAVVAHGFSRRKTLGDTMSRLAQLGSCDLSVDKELIDYLVRAVRRRLPSRVLGFAVHKKTPQLIGLIRALAGTPSPRVRSLMEQIVERFAGHEFATQAAEVLERFGKTEPVEEPQEANLSGDVDLFGLPDLLQRLCDSQFSGELTLVDRAGKTLATLQLEDRKIIGCTTGSLTGMTAFYRIFEKPTHATFTFENRPIEAAGSEPIELTPAILEAIRRHDEFNAARLFVPDAAALVAGDVKPTPCEGEGDLTFMRSIWVKASSGTTAEKCEAAIASDAYRIRRLYVHWVETGALRPA